MNQTLAEARLLARKQMPYMGHAIMSLVPVEQPGLGTMAVDRHSRLYYDPKFLEERPLKDLAFVVLHEAIHVFGRHSRRCVKLLGDNAARDARLPIWRVAVDASVNDVLEESGLKCPEEGVTPAKIGLPRNKTPEEYFNLLLERAAQQERNKSATKAQQGQGDKSDGDQQEQEGQEGQSQATDDEGEAGEGQPGDETGMGQKEDRKGNGEGEDGGDSGGAVGPDDGPGGCGSDNVNRSGVETTEAGTSASEIGGSCMDGQQRPWEQGQPTSENPGLAEHEQNIVEAATSKAIEDYVAQRGRGSVAGGLAKHAADLLHPKVDPCKELAARIKYCVDSTGGFGTYTYQRPNRRQPIGGAMLPAHRKPIPRVTVIIDTSGSMEKSDLDQAMGVVGNALRSLPDPRGLRVLVGGTRVEAAKNIFRADQIELLDGGGTDMAELIDEAAKERPTPKGIICVTDGETGWPAKPVSPRVVVALTRKPHYMPMPPKWMEVVVLNPEE